MKKKNPCFNCTDRELGCHSICNKYIEWKKEVDEERERIVKIKQEEFIKIDVTRKAVNRMKARKGNRVK